MVSIVFEQVPDEGSDKFGLFPSSDFCHLIEEPDDHIKLQSLHSGEVEVGSSRYIVEARRIVASQELVLYEFV